MIAEIKISKEEIEKIVRAYLADKNLNITEITEDVERDYDDLTFVGLVLKVEL